MSDLVKDAKCVTCSKDIKIGKFASAKTAYCEEHAQAKAPRPPKEQKAPAAAAAPAEEPDPFAAAAALESAPEPEKPATASAPLISPAPVAEKEQPPTMSKEDEVNAAKVTPELRALFMSLLGKPVVKDKDKAEAAGFRISPHGVLFKKMPDDRLFCFIEINKRCLGVSVSIGTSTEPVFDVANLYKLKADEQDILSLYQKSFL